MIRNFLIRIFFMVIGYKICFILDYNFHYNIISKRSLQPTIWYFSEHRFECHRLTSGWRSISIPLEFIRKIFNLSSMINFLFSFRYFQFYKNIHTAVIQEIRYITI